MLAIDRKGLDLYLSVPDIIEMPHDIREVELHFIKDGASSPPV
jgi:hypothetical protein